VSLQPRGPFPLTDTIAAPASAAGPGARAVVRLAGPRSLGLVEAVFAPAAEPPGSSRRSGLLRLPGFPAAIPADLLIGHAPRTYTGQDQVEIHLPGSPPLVEAVLAYALTAGARLAQPGEFTLRAFLAGKLDLTQAEAVLGVIGAENPNDLRVALAQLAGGLARPLDHLRQELLHLLAEVEAGLDFAEEDLTFVPAAELARRLETAAAELARLRVQVRERGVSGRPFRVALVGRPNAGKSRLFNALVGRPLALVSPEAGTTRDYLTCRLTVGDVMLELVDTAGAEAAADPIGLQAQAARQGQHEQADLLLYCLPPGEEPTPVGSATPILPIRTMADRVAETVPASTLQTQSGGLRPPLAPELATSAVTGQGLEELRQRLADAARQARRPSALAPSLNRCRQEVTEAGEAVERALGWARQCGFPELVAMELRGALDCLGALVGAVYTDDLLDRIFSQFCIGK
jgi:tRNA modification GTPase